MMSSIRQITLSERECKNVGGFFNEGICSIPVENISVKKTATLEFTHKTEVGGRPPRAYYHFAITDTYHEMMDKPTYFNVTTDGIFNFKYGINKEDLVAIHYLQNDIFAIIRKISGDSP